MIWAYRRDDAGVELYASEANRPAPAGFVQCTLDGFIAAWRLRDSFRIARLRAQLQPAPGGGPGNPYEAQQ